jgi:hypothetical protein
MPTLPILIKNPTKFLEKERKEKKKISERT